MSIKKHALKMIAFNEKNRKIGIIFDIENWLVRNFSIVKLRTYWLLIVRWSTKKRKCYSPHNFKTPFDAEVAGNFWNGT